MARSLSPLMAGAMLGERRQPAYRVEIYDVRSTLGTVSPTRINDIVVANVTGLGGLPELVGPRDFTDDIESIQISETAGDYIDNGIAATDVALRILDRDGLLDPLLSPAPADGRWLRQGNVVVIREGDLQVPESDWPITFTGSLVGQPGREDDRDAATATLVAAAASREVDFLRRSSTSRNFLQGTTYGSMVQDIAEGDMRLDVNELNLPSFGSNITRFVSTQFVEESPLVSIAKIAFVDGLLPRFEGDGRLGMIDGTITKGPARTYDNGREVLRVSRPITKQDGVNEIRIIGLSAELSKVIQDRQQLATASITTGFFTREARINVKWSEDGTQQALDVKMEVDASVADGVLNFGGESFTNFPQVDGGSIAGRIKIDGGLAQGAALAALVATAWVASLTVWDQAIFPSGNTIPIGRAVTVSVGQVLFSILGKVGRGQYRIMGRPYEYVFQEIVSTARVSTVEPEERVELEIENHLLTSQAACDTVAERVLRRERAKQNVRQIEMFHDLLIEPDDVIQVGSGAGARRYMIQRITRELRRGGSAGLCNIDGFEVTAGVLP